MYKNSLTQSKKASLIIVTALCFVLSQAKSIGLEGNEKTSADSSSLSEKTKDSSQPSEYDIYASEANIYKEAQENEMEIENWMLNPADYFLQEKEIELEEWMYDINEPYWQQVLVEDKAEYAIEEWMVNPADWDTNTSLLAGIK